MRFSVPSLLVAQSERFSTRLTTSDRRCRWQHSSALLLGLVTNQCHLLDSKWKLICQLLPSSIEHCPPEVASQRSRLFKLHALAGAKCLNEAGCQCDPVTTRCPFASISQDYAPSHKESDRSAIVPPAADELAMWCGIAPAVRASGWSRITPGAATSCGCPWAASHP